VAELTLVLVVYQDGLPVCIQSRLQLLSGLGVEQLVKTQHCKKTQFPILSGMRNDEATSRDQNASFVSDQMTLSCAKFAADLIYL